jgi:hypothetical protein
MAQIILGGRGVKCMEMNGKSFLEGEMIANELNHTDLFRKKSSSPEPAREFKFL